MAHIVKLVISDILKNRMVLAYTALLAALSWSLFALEDNPGKGMLSLVNIVLLVVPLVSVIFSTIYIYNSAEFIELLLSQPIKRRVIWRQIFFALAITMFLAFILGAGLPVLIFAPWPAALAMLGMGGGLTIVFVSLAFMGASFTRDKAKGIGLAILLWLFFSVLFDGLVLFLTFQFSDYPIEKALVGVSLLNPVDMGRVLMLLQMDESVLMGYTGAIFKEFFGTALGMSISGLALVLWIWIPYFISRHRFETIDV